jgi:hypothetical protein
MNDPRILFFVQGRFAGRDSEISSDSIRRPGHLRVRTFKLQEKLKIRRPQVVRDWSFAERAKK